MTILVYDVNNDEAADKNNPRELTHPVNVTDEYKFDTYQRYVAGPNERSGMVQYVPIKVDGEPADLLCNEEGLFNGCKFNKRATDVYGDQVIGHRLVGVVIILTGKDRLK